MRQWSVAQNASVAEKVQPWPQAPGALQCFRGPVLGLCMSKKKGAIRVPWKSVTLRACVKCVPSALTLAGSYLTSFEIFVWLVFGFSR